MVKLPAKVWEQLVLERHTKQGFWMEGMFYLSWSWLVFTKLGVYDSCSFLYGYHISSERVFKPW